MGAPTMLRVLALCCFAVASADLIIQKPLASKTGDEKLLVIINGAYVANTNYAELGTAIQKASPLKLWVAIPSFVLNCPNPGQIGGKVSDAVQQVKSNGFASITPSQDVFISGHSLGGIFSQKVVGGGGYAGLILFGSYLTSINGYSLESFKYPVLTLAGELDGLTHITRIAKEYEGMQARVSSDGPSAHYRFPVVALPGQSHSQFCSGVNVTSFGNKDLMPEVGWQEAHEAIGQAVNNFFTLVLDPSDAAAKSYMDARFKYTSSLLEGWFTSQKLESSWCSHAQELNAANVRATFHVNTSTCSNWASFDATFPSVTAAKNQVMVVDELQYHFNPTDSSLVDRSATEIDCKLMTEASIMTAFGQKVANMT